ncbi:DUF1810 domain-containing protein [Ruegeria sp. HKCCA5491]|uniref:DUF1810 domain-containing protein n=1 Tax=Ruegeria sp. HKCCA5491 TaxID=2682986 RepID=UPI001487CC3F
MTEDDGIGDELDLFIEAQDTVWSDVLRELKQGQKTSHWMWFVFPQLAALGRSDMAQLYGIEDLDEATAYLDHPELRKRLIETAQLMLLHKGRDATDILGGIDGKKLRSCMTLFSSVPDAPPEFLAVLDAFYDGQRCERTVQLLQGS